MRTVLCSEKEQAAVAILRVLFSEICSREAKTRRVFCCMMSLATSEPHAMSSYCGLEVWSWNGMQIADFE
jgi:hypothetical protein